MFQIKLVWIKGSLFQYIVNIKHIIKIRSIQRVDLNPVEHPCE
jgi:hypothetical protein